MEKIVKNKAAVTVLLILLWVILSGLCFVIGLGIHNVSHSL